MNEILKTTIDLLGGTFKTAKLVGVKPPAISDWVSGKRPVPIKRCVQLEQLTGGFVTRKDLRPDDWYEIWPELLTTPKELNHESTIS